MVRGCEGRAPTPDMAGGVGDLDDCGSLDLGLEFELVELCGPPDLQEAQQQEAAGLGRCLPSEQGGMHS